MAFRFRRSIKIAPGVRVNLSKSGGSLSVGERGATLNAGKRGVYTTIGYPGIGLSYRQRVGGRAGRGSAKVLFWTFVVLGALWAIGHFGPVIFR